ncbi:MAG TPA: response regulator transcription factor [Stellaceae bacterium]|jgi:two-component system response regulator ChvI|nr:response regulator transcription factor [Stellaceae bacterium]
MTTQQREQSGTKAWPDSRRSAAADPRNAPAPAPRPVAKPAAPAKAVTGDKPVASADRLKILLVDDDDDYREAASGELEHLNFDVVSFPSGDGMLDYFAGNNSVDIIVLDWKLPQGLGIDLLPKLHDRGIKLPVVFLTGVAATAYESAALDGGALDFVDKARGVPILAKRLHLILDSRQRTAQNPSKQGLRCGKLVLRPDASRAYWADHDVDLTVTEFNIINLMVTHAGEHVTYRSIYDCVHHAGFLAGSGDEGFRTNVRSSIKRIRNKFRSLDNEFAEIENFPAFGYRWRNGPAQPA